ncbi:MAG: cupin domain-containing protein [Bacteroidota bacterium]
MKIVLLLISLLSITAFAQENKDFTIDNCVSTFDISKLEITKAGYQFWFVDKNFLDGRTIKLSSVAPNSDAHPPHAHQEDEFFFILEGKAELYLAGKTRIVEGYASFYCPSNVEHRLRNVGDKELKYLVIKKYNK